MNIAPWAKIPVGIIVASVIFHYGFEYYVETHPKPISADAQSYFKDFSVADNRCTPFEYVKHGSSEVLK